jgi:hypothetical protein
MKRRLVRGLGLPATVLFLTGCFTDAATRLAYDIESGMNRMNQQNETRHSIRHAPAESSECAGPYTVQLDKVGALSCGARMRPERSSQAAARHITRASSIRRQPTFWTSRPVQS